MIAFFAMEFITFIYSVLLYNKPLTCQVFVRLNL